MTINLTELRDEPLGKHPIQAALNCYTTGCYINGIDVEQDVIPADHESSFTFDVEGLGDEALDPPKSLFVLGCSNGCATIYQPVLARGQGSKG